MLVTVDLADATTIAPGVQTAIDASATIDILVDNAVVRDIDQPMSKPSLFDSYGEGSAQTIHTSARFIVSRSGHCLGSRDHWRRHGFGGTVEE
jgi:hypothetical protein